MGAAASEGLPVRDMNHDMIAAGHPALIDSYAQLLARLPRHWQEKDRTQPSQPERTMSQSALETTGKQAFKVALDILATDRKTRNDARTPQPELSEQSCVSCHHSLKP